MDEWAPTMDADKAPEDDSSPDFSDPQAGWDEEKRARLERVNDEAMRAAVATIQNSGREGRVGRMDFMGDRHRMYMGMYIKRDTGDLEPWAVIGDHWDKFGKLAPEVVFLAEERSWTLGAVIGPRLGLRLWPLLSPRAKANYLAGTSLLTEIEKRLVLMPEYSDMEVDWDADSLAAFVCNAIYYEKNDRFLRAVSGRDLRAMTITRNRDGQHGWVAEDIPEPERRLVDVFYECALRSMNVPVLKYCLQHGAEPNPLLETRKYTTRWSTALSYLMDKYNDSTGYRTHPKGLVDLILQHHPAGEGHPLEGLNRPLYMAWSNKRLDAVDRLLDLGAKFEGGFFARTPLSPEVKAQVLPPSVSRMAVSNEFGLSIRDRAKLNELWEAVSDAIPLSPWHEVPWYEGGWCAYKMFGNFMGTVLYRNDPTYLQRFLSRGMPLKLTLPDVVYAMHRDPREAFSAVLRAKGLNPDATIARLRRCMSVLRPAWHGD
ncbi:hypothetical protein DES53_1155 [Roseimicrobium gellanilyticum]|uniref:Ankyrin repeat protein n=2 Tax=Roseimicrobium gellanilyticum TaxID=748857 RepID=A0A366H4C1_9BACT|nr:hypothetical protein DES53_1155 [Roseimicrobium gellanilyticum]